MTQTATKPKVTVNIDKAQILADLNAGLTRKEIYAKYGHSAASGKAMITRFGLKNAKRKGADSGITFVYTDSTVEGVTAAAEAAVAHIEAPVEAPVKAPVESSDDLY